MLLAIAGRFLLTEANIIEIQLNWPVSFLAGAALLLVAGVFISYYEYHGFGSQEGIVRCGSSERREIAITFDDGPNPRYTPAILDALKTKGVKATFFVTGRHVQKYPEIAKRIAVEGHDIGNHTYSHRELVPATRQAVVWQVRQAARVIEEVTGRKTRLMRPPRGIYSNAVRQLLVEEGYQIVLWTVSGIDWRGVSAKRIARRVLRYAQPGGIILLHDGGALLRREGASRRNTVEALPLIINGLRERGYRIVTMSHMLSEEEREAEAVEVSLC